MSGRRKLGWGAAAVVNLLAIAAILGIAELGARHLAGGGPTDRDEQLPMCRSDTATVWRYKPDVALGYRAPEFRMDIRTNGSGFRSPAEAADDRRPVVLFIGDSFTFGWGVAEEERFSEVMARQLGGVRIVNAGHWMYAFDQQLVLLKELIARHKPAVVVQGFYWMHVRTLVHHGLERGADGSIVAVRAPSLKVDPQGVLRFHSEWVDDPPFGSQLAALAARWVLNRDVRRQAAAWVDYMQPGSTKDSELWAMADESVSQTIAALRTAGIPYVPFLIPVSVEVGGSGWSHVGWMGKDPPAGVDVALPLRRVAAMLETRGTPVIDLTEPLKARGGAALYFPMDGHWTADGHRVVGERLARDVARALDR